MIKLLLSVASLERSCRHELPHWDRPQQLECCSIVSLDLIRARVFRVFSFENLESKAGEARAA